jgi:hypothetical protein
MLGELEVGKDTHMELKGTKVDGFLGRGPGV